MTITTVDLTTLDTRGFVCIPDFLNEADLNRLRQDFENATPLNNKNYCIRRVSSEVFSHFQDKLQILAGQIQAQTHTFVDAFTTSGVYFPNWKQGPTLVDSDPNKQRFPWHQDHESYFTLQDHTYYLNFYSPIIKPLPEQSNLSIIPLDSLMEKVPEIGAKMLGRGATRVIQDPQGTDLILDDDQGGIIAKLGFPIIEIAETPQLKAGDLLILRGDVLHRTQDANTQRVAVSFRMFNQNTLISRKKLISGGVIKTIMMIANWRAYELRFRYFDTFKTETTTPLEMNQYLINHSLPSDCDLTQFVWRLLRERLVTGTLLNTLWDLRLFPLSRTGIL